MCGTSSCCCCCPANGGEQPPPDGGGEERCTRFRLTIDSIDVSAIDDGFLGGDLEATFTFVVNGQTRTYVNNDLGTGVTTIGITFFVDVPTEQSTISLTVSGVEDDVFVDDPIAGFTRVFGQPENFGQGFQTGSASDSNITYTLNYTITCAQDVRVAVSRRSLLAYARDKAERRRVDFPGDQIGVAWSLDRLRRDGWRLVTASGEEFVLEGPGTLPQLLERRFGGEG